MNPSTLNASPAEIVILLFGIVVAGLCVWAMFVPEQLRKFVIAITDTTAGYYFAAAVRLFLGIVLILAAPNSRFPVIFEIIGWLAIVAAVALMFIGQERLSKMVAWFTRFSDLTMRVWLVLGVAFGAFLVYGVL